MKNYCEHMKTVAHIKGAKHVINYSTITSMKGLIFITVFSVFIFWLKLFIDWLR